MNLEENVSLLPYNTFHIDAYARYFQKVHNLAQLEEALNADILQKQPVLIVGGGSNLLFTDNYDGLVIKNEMMGIAVTGKDDTNVYVKAGAGENWHRFVLYCIENNLAGVENLSLIPGNTGACPIQNIGAYGVEIKDVFQELEAYDTADKKLVTFGLQDCGFGYRESIFKKRYKGRFIILNITFRLSEIPHFNIGYGALQQELEKAGVKELSIRAVSDAVINIRQSKLPDPAVIGNAGSFFKNPTVAISQYQQLKDDYNTMPGYPGDNETIKLAAGWLIEQCGWKGYRKGDAGCYDKQALVLVNYGKSSGKDIFDLSQHIVDSVEKKFGVVLEREVNIIGRKP